jgi:hypothetical protein
MIASAATVTTHHHHRNPSTGDTKVLRIGYRKTFCVDCTRGSLYFGRKLAFEHVYRVDGSTTYKMLASNYSEYGNRWILDDKWIEIIRSSYIDNPSKEKGDELKVNRGNMVRAIGYRWNKTEIQDFTPTYQSGIFRHCYSVTYEVKYDEGEMVSKERQVTYLYATIPGQDYPRKPRVAKVFKDEDEMHG